MKSQKTRFFKPWKDYVKKAHTEVWHCKNVMEKLQDDWLSSAHTMQDLFPTDTTVSLSELLCKKKQLSKCHLVTLLTKEHWVSQSGKLKPYMVYFLVSTLVMVISASPVFNSNKKTVTKSMWKKYTFTTVNRLNTSLSK